MTKVITDAFFMGRIICLFLINTGHKICFVVANDDDEFMEDFDEAALDEKLKKSEKIGKPLVIPPSLAAPPGLNVFSQIKGEHAFRYFSFGRFFISLS